MSSPKEQPHSPRLPGGRLIVSMVALCFALELSGPALAAQVRSAGCVSGKQGVTCDQAAFQKLFADAKSAAIGTEPNNRMAAAELASTLSKLGKMVQAESGPADVTLVVSRVNTEGVMIGPAGMELATLRAYGLGPGGRRGDLIWSETYTGQSDLTWPAIVHGLLRQWQG